MMSYCDEEKNYEELKRALAKIDIYIDAVKSRLSEVRHMGDVKTPALLENVTLRDYQIEGFQWINTLYENGMNGILADEMGLGKTVQVIAALCNLIELGVSGPFLIVTPLSLLSSWSDQLASFAPRIPCIIYYGALKERLYLRKQIRRRIQISPNEPIKLNMSPSEISKTTVESSDINASLSLESNESTNLKLKQNNKVLEMNRTTSAYSSSSYASPSSNILGHTLEFSFSSNAHGQIEQASKLHQDNHQNYELYKEHLLQNLDNTITSVLETECSYDKSENKYDLAEFGNSCKNNQICGPATTFDESCEPPGKSAQLFEMESIKMIEPSGLDEIRSSKTISDSDMNGKETGEIIDSQALGSLLNLQHPKTSSDTNGNSKQEEMFQSEYVEHKDSNSNNCLEEDQQYSDPLQSTNNSEYNSNFDNIIEPLTSTTSSSSIKSTHVLVPILRTANSLLYSNKSIDEKCAEEMNRIDEITNVSLTDSIEDIGKLEKKLYTSNHSQSVKRDMTENESTNLQARTELIDGGTKPCSLKSGHDNDIPNSRISTSSIELRQGTDASNYCVQNGEIKKECEKSELPERLDVIKSHFWTCPIVLTSYDVAMRDASYLQKIPFKALIVDEGQRLKNPFCKLYKRLAKFSTGLRILVTGTPLQNRLSELWSLLHFILPEIFTSIEMFSCWFDPKTLNDISNLDRLAIAEVERSLITNLHQIIHPFMLRRSKSHAKLCIPPKREVLLYAKMTDLQKKVYDYAVKQILANSKPKSEKCRGNGSGSLTWLDPSNIIPYPVNAMKQDKGKSKFSSKILTRFTRQSILSKQEFIVQHSKSKNNNINKDHVSQFANSSQVKSTNLTASTQNFESEFTLLPYISLNNGFMLLRRIVNHPYLAIERPDSFEGDPNEKSESEAHTTEKQDNCSIRDLINASGKTILVERLLTTLISNGHKVIIFSQLTMILDLLEELLDAKSWAFVRLDGTTKFSERREAIRRFNFEPIDQLPIFLVSTRAGGTGLNLQAAADTVIIFDSDWNPQTDLQAQDRCHRIGQTKPVLVIRLVTSGSIDEVILRRAQAKRGLERLILTSGRKNVGSLLQSTICNGYRKLSKNQVHPIRAKREWKSPNNNEDSLPNSEHNSDFALTKPELLCLLNKKDHHREMQTENVITDDVLNSLIDRSDLYDMWEKQKNGLDVSLMPEFVNQHQDNANKNLKYQISSEIIEVDRCKNTIPNSPRKTRLATKRDHNGIIKMNSLDETAKQRYNIRNREP